jgi:hypothetical protein
MAKMKMKTFHQITLIVFITKSSSAAAKAIVVVVKDVRMYHKVFQKLQIKSIDDTLLYTIEEVP